MFVSLTEEGPSTSTSTTTTNVQQPEDAPVTSDICESVASSIDPANRLCLSDKVRTELVSRGPYAVKSDFKFPNCSPRAGPGGVAWDFPRQSMGGYLLGSVHKQM